MRTEQAMALRIAAGWRDTALALTGGAALALGLMTGIARGEETIMKSHGYSTYGDLKYPADFAHLDYVNPDAPKGGEIMHLGAGHLRQLQPLRPQGRAGVLATIGYEIDADLGRRRGVGAVLPAVRKPRIPRDRGLGDLPHAPRHRSSPTARR